MAGVYPGSVVVTVVQVVAVYISLCVGFDRTIARDEVEDRECFGTANGFSSSGTSDFRYNLLRKRYLGCTYVLGNLEITHLEEPRIQYDLSFLRHIRYVSGYLLIGLVSEVTQIPLLSLEMIRGNDTFAFQGENYSMMVALTSREEELDQNPSKGLTTLMMPKLKEISHGKVIFIQNPSLGFIDTVDWEPIMRGRLDAVHFGQEPYNQSASNGTDLDLCRGGGMWGSDETLCQEVVKTDICDVTCGGLCFGPGPDECCHHTCAVACTGPGDKDCRNCKDFRFEDKCVAFCPHLSYQLMQDCISYIPLNPL